MAFEIRITMLIHNKDDIEFVTEFPCFLGHPVLAREPLKLNPFNLEFSSQAKTFP